MNKGTMRQKFARRINEKAIKWFEANGFKPPYIEARSQENLPEYVKTYFKHHKQKNIDTSIEPEA